MYVYHIPWSTMVCQWFVDFWLQYAWNGWLGQSTNENRLRPHDVYCTSDSLPAEVESLVLFAIELNWPISHLYRQSTNFSWIDGHSQQDYQNNKFHLGGAGGSSLVLSRVPCFYAPHLDGWSRQGPARLSEAFTKMQAMVHICFMRLYPQDDELNTQTFQWD